MVVVLVYVCAVSLTERCVLALDLLLGKHYHESLLTSCSDFHLYPCIFNGTFSRTLQSVQNRRSSKLIP